jgi:hypothetical protein
MDPNRKKIARVPGISDSLQNKLEDMIQHMPLVDGTRHIGTDAADDPAAEPGCSLSFVPMSVGDAMLAGAMESGEPAVLDGVPWAVVRSWPTADGEIAYDLRPVRH